MGGRFSWRQWLRRVAARRRPRPYRHAHRPNFERLEDRLAPATWSGNLSDPAPGTPLWTNDQVQEVLGNVTVPFGGTLTVQAGTVVKFHGGNLTVDGTLVVQGAPGQTTYFTAIQDDSVGGD